MQDNISRNQGSWPNSPLTAASGAWSAVILVALSMADRISAERFMDDSAICTCAVS